MSDLAEKGRQLCNSWLSFVVLQEVIDSVHSLHHQQHQGQHHSYSDDYCETQNRIPILIR